MGPRSTRIPSMARHGRYFLPDQPLHVIQRGNNRGAIFFAAADYEQYRAWLAEAAPEYGRLRPPHGPTTHPLRPPAPPPPRPHPPPPPPHPPAPPLLPPAPPAVPTLPLQGPGWGPGGGAKQTPAGGGGASLRRFTPPQKRETPRHVRSYRYEEA